MTGSILYIIKWFRALFQKKQPPAVTYANPHMRWTEYKVLIPPDVLTDISDFPTPARFNHWAFEWDKGTYIYKGETE